jgi:hypothetical protein
MVLVVTPGDGQPESSPQGPLPVGGLVIAVAGHGGGVVVQLVQFDAELADGVRHGRQRQRGDVGVEEAVEAAADAVVVERRQLRRGEPEGFGGVAGGPLADAVEGLTREQEVLQQDQPGGRGGDARPAVLAGQVFAEELLAAEPPEEALQQGQRGDAAGGQGPAGGASGLAGALWRGGLIARVVRRMPHGIVPRHTRRDRSGRPVRRDLRRHGCRARWSVKGRKSLKNLLSIRLDVSRAARDLRSGYRP